MCCAGTLALILYTVLLSRRPASVLSPQQTITGLSRLNLAPPSLRTFSPRPVQALARKHLSLNTTAMAKESLRPVKQIVQGDKKMEGECPSRQGFHLKFVTDHRCFRLP